jgi:hypothetical protein
MPSDPNATRLSRTTKTISGILVILIVTILIIFLMILRDPSRRIRKDADLAEAPPSRPHHPLKRHEEHVKKVDAKMAPLTARFHAEPGATPCESAFNSFRAFLKADVSRRNSTFALPERSVFLDRCQGLSKQEQLCLRPESAATHPDICQPLYKDLTAKLFIVVSD